mmetsp:Transcript_144681/g.463581  ORF Transcript_144681/g.463581 Transcript_144681/m.463581 type:complete len:285 (-) Transcript_144681:1597-2451(-)
MCNCKLIVEASGVPVRWWGTTPLVCESPSPTRVLVHLPAAGAIHDHFRFHLLHKTAFRPTGISITQRSIGHPKTQCVKGCDLGWNPLDPIDMQHCLGEVARVTTRRELRIGQYRKVHPWNRDTASSDAIVEGGLIPVVCASSVQCLQAAQPRIDHANDGCRWLHVQEATAIVSREKLALSAIVVCKQQLSPGKLGDLSKGILQPNHVDVAVQHCALLPEESEQVPRFPVQYSPVQALLRLTVGNLVQHHSAYGRCNRAEAETVVAADYIEAVARRQGSSIGPQQ